MKHDRKVKEKNNQKILKAWHFVRSIASHCLRNNVLNLSFLCYAGHLSLLKLCIVLLYFSAPHLNLVSFLFIKTIATDPLVYVLLLTIYLEIYLIFCKQFIQWSETTVSEPKFCECRGSVAF